MHERRTADVPHIVQKRHRQRVSSHPHAQENHQNNQIVGRRDECRKMGFGETTVFKVSDHAPHRALQPFAMTQGTDGRDVHQPSEIRRAGGESLRAGGTGGPGNPEGRDAGGAEFPEREDHSEWIESRISEDMRVLRAWQNEHQGETTLNLPPQVLRAIAINRQMYQNARDPRLLEAVQVTIPEHNSLQFAVVERGVNEPTNRESLEYAQKKDLDRPSDVDPFNWEYPNLLERNIIGETDRVLYYTRLEATRGENDADLHVSDIIVHPEERRQGMARRFYEKIKRFAKDQNFRYITGRHDIDYKGPEQPSTIEIFQKLGRKRYIDLSAGDVKDRFYDLYEGRNLDNLTYDDLEPRIELQRNATLDAILERLPDIQLDPEFIREQTLRLIIPAPFSDENAIRGPIIEMEFRRRLELLAETDEFRGRIRFHPSTRAETEHYSLLPSQSSSEGTEIIHAESGRIAGEYDVLIEILDPESDEWIPTDIELKAGRSFVPERAGKVTDEGRRNERLYPLLEYYNSPKMSFVVVRQVLPSGERSEERDFYLSELPFAGEEVNRLVGSALDSFERVDDQEAQMSPTGEASGDISAITTRYRELLQETPQGTVLPSLNVLATSEHISLNAARRIYERFKKERLAHAVEGVGIVAGRQRGRAPLRQNFDRTRNEPFIRTFLNSDLHDGELLIFNELEERLGASRDIVGDILVQLYQEGYITRFPQRKASIYYFGTDPSNFHRRYHSDPVEHAKELLNSGIEDNDISTVAQRRGIQRRHVNIARRELRQEAERERRGEE